jgi:hypothetical protein
VQYSCLARIFTVAWAKDVENEGPNQRNCGATTSPKSILRSIIASSLCDGQKSNTGFLPQNGHTDFALLGFACWSGPNRRYARPVQMRVRRTMPETHQREIRMFSSDTISLCRPRFCRNRFSVRVSAIGEKNEVTSIPARMPKRSCNMGWSFSQWQTLKVI